MKNFISNIPLLIGAASISSFAIAISGRAIYVNDSVKTPESVHKLKQVRLIC